MDSFGVFTCMMSVVGFYWSLTGVPPDVAAKLGTTMSQMPSWFLTALSAGFAIYGIIHLVIGVFAWQRHTWAVIAGTICWMAMALHGPDTSSAIGTVTASVFALLATLVAATKWRLRSVPPSLSVAGKT